MPVCPACDAEVPAHAQFCGHCGATLGEADDDSSAADYPTPLLPGTFLEGKYQVLEEVERGGMGVVYRGHDLTLDRTVAIKALPPHFNTNADIVKRFKREARAMAALDHPNIVTVYSIGQQGETHYFAMKFLEGRTVAEELIQMRNRGGPFFDQRTVIDVLRQVAQGLAHAHQRGLIHRDIKPSNIMLAPDGHVTIMDFGIVKRQVENSALTKAGVVFGTPEYMAPEQAQGNMPPDQSTDLYSLGIVAYEMLVGAPPFHGSTAVDVVLQHIQNVPDPLEERGVRGVDPNFEAILFRMFTKNPSERFTSGEALCQALDELTLGSIMSSSTGRAFGSVPIASTRELMASAIESVPPRPIVEINRSQPPSDAPAAAPTPSSVPPPGTYDLSTLTRPEPDRRPVTLTDIHGKKGPSSLLLVVLAAVAFVGVWIWFSKSDPVADNSKAVPRGLPQWMLKRDAGVGADDTPVHAAATQAPAPEFIQVHLATRPRGAEIYAADDLTTPLGTTPDIIQRAGKAITRDLVLRKPGFHDKRVTVSFMKSKQYVIDLIPSP